MKARWKILIAFGVMLLVIVAACFVTMHLQPENEVEAYKQFLRDKGEKLEIAEVLPPPMPPESNGVALARSAFALFISSSLDWTNLPPTMQMIAPGWAVVGWAQPEVRGRDFTNSWSNIMSAAAANHPAVELLRQAMGYPAFDFQLKYEDGIFMMLPHLSPFKRSSQALSAAMMCDLHNGDAASATTNLCALLALVNGTRDERTIISQLVRMAMTSIAASASWEWLQSTNLTDAELLMLQSKWEQLEFVHPLEKSFLMERASAETSIQKMRSSQSELHRMTGLYSSLGSGGPSASSGWAGSGDWFEDARDLAKSGWDRTKQAGAEFMWRTSWTYSDELRALQGDQILLETLRAIGTNWIFQPAYSDADVRLMALGVTNFSGDLLFDFDDFNLRSLFSGSVRSLSATIRKAMIAEMTKQVVTTAIALKRYQLQHGTLPETLSELAPQFLASVPLDPVDGKPLRYRRNADETYLLYSIGENNVDDGGDPTLPASASSTTWYWQNPKARDWVWPQPATVAEIKYFDEHPPK